eukprot:6213619-Pleurochrysis_carterae.AAC.1
MPDARVIGLWLAWMPRHITTECHSAKPGARSLYLTARTTGQANQRHPGEGRQTWRSDSEAVRQRCVCDIE